MRLQGSCAELGSKSSAVGEMARVESSKCNFMVVFGSYGCLRNASHKTVLWSVYGESGNRMTGDVWEVILQRRHQQLAASTGEYGVKFWHDNILLSIRQRRGMED
jgi:hypothetical protein